MGKHIITGYNYAMPSIHLAIYARKTDYASVTVPHTNSDTNIRSSNIFQQELHDFGDIIDHNILDNFI